VKSKLIEILFGNYRRKILALLLLRPDEKFHVRDIARRIDVPVGSLHRELKLLAEGELLLRAKSGNQVYYQANRDCQVFNELAGLFRKTIGLADVIQDALAPLNGKVELAFIFGSVAQGKERTGSDIDLFVVGDVSFIDVVGALSETHQQLGREINPVIMSRLELQKKAATDPFIVRLISEMKIFVRGNADDFGQLIEDRTTEGAHDNS
jgi:predicted nucleotidyltransferase